MYFVTVVLYFIFLPHCIGNLTTSECYNGFMRDADCCEGFKRINGTGDCIPICEKGCPESKICREPNYCGPHFKFKKDREVCHTMMINTKNYCGKCNPSHIFKNRQCLPYCGNCKNGFCESPGGLCKCKQGFEKDLTTKTCRLIKSFDAFNEYINQNSTAVGQISKISPKVSVTPNCQNDCSDGNCASKLCQNQTSSIEENTTKVTSNCQNGCLMGGICINGTCQKHKSTSTELQTSTTINVTSNCQNNCQNGICVAAKRCKCIDGDTSRLNISTVVFDCRDKCGDVFRKKGCLSGTCKCQCFGGFFPKPGSQFECVANLEDTTDDTRRILLYSIGLIVILAVLIIIIVIGCYSHRKRRRNSDIGQGFEMSNSFIRYGNGSVCIN